MRHALRSAFTLMFGLVLLASCAGKDEARHLAIQQLQDGDSHPEKLKILAVSEPDSAFGTSYLTQQEVMGMIKLMKSVTDTIMARTDGMTRLNPNDYYVLSLADRQMRASNEIRDIVFRSGKREKWSGWKIKIDYQSIGHNGIPFKAERWCFVDKEARHVMRTFDIPLP